ncbi:MAG: hypothetical protein LBB54_06780, partial [Cellulomonadaceae bacterium]|nr:hypothetical protein [Cellulomonadaceae bacterium]
MADACLPAGPEQPAQSEEQQGMELADYLTILRRRWLSLSLLTLAGVVAALVVSLATTPLYTAQAQVFVSVRGADTTGDLLQGANFTMRQVRSYTQLVSSPRVLDPVIAELGLPVSATELARAVRAESPLDTVLINVSADDPSPELAAA